MKQPEPRRVLRGVGLGLAAAIVVAAGAGLAVRLRAADSGGGEESAKEGKITITVFIEHYDNYDDTGDANALLEDIVAKYRATMASVLAGGLPTSASRPDKAAQPKEKKGGGLFGGLFGKGKAKPPTPPAGAPPVPDVGYEIHGYKADGTEVGVEDRAEAVNLRADDFADKVLRAAVMRIEKDTSALRDRPLPPRVRSIPGAVGKPAPDLLVFLPNLPSDKLTKEASLANQAGCFVYLRDPVAVRNVSVRVGDLMVDRNRVRQFSVDEKTGEYVSDFGFPAYSAYDDTGTAGGEARPATEPAPAGAEAKAGSEAAPANVPRQRAFFCLSSVLQHVDTAKPTTLRLDPTEGKLTHEVAGAGTGEELSRKIETRLYFRYRELVGQAAVIEFLRSRLVIDDFVCLRVTGKGLEENGLLFLIALQFACSPGELEKYAVKPTWWDRFVVEPVLKPMARTVNKLPGVFWNPQTSKEELIRKAIERQKGWEGVDTGEINWEACRVDRLEGGRYDRPRAYLEPGRVRYLRGTPDFEFPFLLNFKHQLGQIAQGYIELRMDCEIPPALRPGFDPSSLFLNCIMGDGAFEGVELLPRNIKTQNTQVSIRNVTHTLDVGTEGDSGMPVLYQLVYRKQVEPPAASDPPSQGAAVVAAGPVYDYFLLGTVFGYATLKPLDRVWFRWTDRGVSPDLVETPVPLRGSGRDERNTVYIGLSDGLRPAQFGTLLTQFPATREWWEKIRDFFAKQNQNVTIECATEKGGKGILPYPPRQWIEIPYPEPLASSNAYLVYRLRDAKTFWEKISDKVTGAANWAKTILGFMPEEPDDVFYDTPFRAVRYNQQFLIIPNVYTDSTENVRDHLDVFCLRQDERAAAAQRRAGAETELPPEEVMAVWSGADRQWLYSDAFAKETKKEPTPAKALEPAKAAEPAKAVEPAAKPEEPGKSAEPAVAQAAGTGEAAKPAPPEATSGEPGKPTEPGRLPEPAKSAPEMSESQRARFAALAGEFLLQLAKWKEQYSKVALAKTQTQPTEKEFPLVVYADVNFYNRVNLLGFPPDDALNDRVRVLVEDSIDVLTQKPRNWFMRVFLRRRDPIRKAAAYEGQKDTFVPMVNHLAQSSNTPLLFQKVSFYNYGLSADANPYYYFEDAAMQKPYRTRDESVSGRWFSLDSSPRPGAPWKHSLEFRNFVFGKSSLPQPPDCDENPVLYGVRTPPGSDPGSIRREPVGFAGGPPPTEMKYLRRFYSTDLFLERSQEFNLELQNFGLYRLVEDMKTQILDVESLRKFNTEVANILRRLKATEAQKRMLKRKHLSRRGDLDIVPQLADEFTAALGVKRDTRLPLGELGPGFFTRREEYKAVYRCTEPGGESKRPATACYFQVGDKNYYKVLQDSSKRGQYELVSKLPEDTTQDFLAIGRTNPGGPGWEDVLLPKGADSQYFSFLDPVTRAYWWTTLVGWYERDWTTGGVPVALPVRNSVYKVLYAVGLPADTTVQAIQYEALYYSLKLSNGTELHLDFAGNAIPAGSLAEQGMQAVHTQFTKLGADTSVTIPPLCHGTFEEFKMQYGKDPRYGNAIAYLARRFEGTAERYCWFESQDQILGRQSAGAK